MLWTRAGSQNLLPQEARRFKEITNVQDYKPNAETCGLYQHTRSGSFYTRVCVYTSVNTQEAFDKSQLSLCDKELLQNALSNLP